MVRGHGHVPAHLQWFTCLASKTLVACGAMGRGHGILVVFLGLRRLGTMGRGKASAEVPQRGSSIWGSFSSGSSVYGPPRARTDKCGGWTDPLQ